MKKILCLLAVWMLVTTFACGGCSNGPGEVRDLTENEQKLVESSNRFGFKLFSEVVFQSDGDNVFISPLSVSMALGMTYHGARSTTEEAMRVTLQFGELTTEEISQGYRDLIYMLINLDPKVTMEIANSIWYREGFGVLPDFIDLNQAFFDALVTALDFASPEAAAIINAWVKEKTHGKIDEIVDNPIDPDTVMFLINAIYFKGTWTYEFDPNQTQYGIFHAPAGEKNVQMMSLHTKLRYQETDDFQAVDLPYGDGMFSMTILLPKPGRDIDALVAELSDQNWEAWMAGFQEEEGDIYLPRFELKYEIKLNEVLKALGMEVAFTLGKADFTGINPIGDLFISEVKHKTYVKVNEEGTEAAAVTSVEISRTSVGPEGFVIRIDRPFIFIIHDAHSKALLFMGKIVDPPS